MPQADLYPSPTPTSPVGALDLDDLERLALKSRAVACALIAGLPGVGILASFFTGLPLFASLMAGCFLLATALVARKALVTFTGKTLRLLVTARLVIIVVLGSLLFCTSGSGWAAVVSATLLWLVADRLLGRRALADLHKTVRGRR